MTLGEVAAVVGVAATVTGSTVGAVSILAYRIFVPRQECSVTHRELATASSGDASDLRHLAESLKEVAQEVKKVTGGLAEIIGDIKVLSAERHNGKGMEKLADAIMTAIGRK
jgi:hypothetical protein